MASAWAKSNFPLTKARRATTIGNQDLEQFLLHEHRAMHTDFSRIFARKRVWCLEKSHQNLIQQFTFINKVSMIGLVGNYFADFQKLATTLEQISNYRESLGTRNSDRCNRAHAMRRGDSADGVAIEDVGLHLT